VSDATSDKKPLALRLVNARVEEGLLLALSAPFAYAVAFSYEAGFADHFGYPSFLIQVDLRGALVAWLILLPVILFVLQAAVTLMMVLPTRVARVAALQFAFSGIYSFAVAAAIYFLITHRHPRWLVLLMFILGGVGLIFEVSALVVRPLVSEKFQGTKLQRLEQALDERIKDPRFKAIREIFGTQGLRRLVGIVWVSLAAFLAALSAAEFVGSWTAGRQEQFLVKHMPREVIAVRRYGDQVVAAMFDPNANQIICRYVVVPLVDLEGEPWTLQKLQPPKVVNFSRQEACS